MSTLRSTDLMIGDYVRVVHLNKIGRIYRVDAANGHGNEYAALLDGDFDCKDLEPIPLTPEILEKNGFKIEIAPYTPDWMRCILNPNFFLEDRLKGFYHFNGNNLAKIQYVHELQHALKLCGIEKNIII